MSSRDLRPLGVLCLALLLPAAQAQEAAPQFSIKDSEARTGSKFRREIATSTRVPLNLRYEQMSPQQQADLKAPYEQMGPNDEPPFPAQGLKAVVSEMIEAQKILQVQGQLRLHAQINAQGRVTSVAIMESVDRQFDAYVAGILSRTRFKPALCAGQPCSQDYLFHWQLSLTPG